MKKYCMLVGILAGSLMYAADTLAQHKAPNEQPSQAGEAAAPTGEVLLGTVRIPKPVTADGKPLPAGTYSVRLTAREAAPAAVGVTESLERWVEFLQGKEAKGREVVSIVPQAEIKLVAKDAPPPSGGSKVQLLKGGDYLRVWINRGGTHYLVHLPTGSTAGS